MNTKLSIEGIYTRVGNQLKRGDIQLHILKRKKPTKKKAQHYLQQLKPQIKYVSSLYNYQVDYPGGEEVETYTLETEGKYYIVTLTTTEGAIVATETPKVIFL